jgi:Sec-independent protein translocase protein TatA
MELTIIPAVVLTGPLASQNWSAGVWELIIILIIALILSGVKRLSDLKGMAEGTAESIRNFVESIGKFKSGITPEPRRRSSDSRPWVFIVIALTATVIILSVLGLYGFSDEQKLALAVVLLGWIGVGYWSFGRHLRKRSGQ